jgi:hypothetical protein
VRSFVGAIPRESKRAYAIQCARIQATGDQILRARIRYCSDVCDRDGRIIERDVGKMTMKIVGEATPDNVGMVEVD